MIYMWVGAAAAGRTCRAVAAAAADVWMGTAAAWRTCRARAAEAAAADM